MWSCETPALILVPSDRYRGRNGPCVTRTTGEIRSGSGRNDMGKLLQRLLFFVLLFEGLSHLRLATVVTAITLVIAITVWTHLLLQSGADSA